MGLFFLINGWAGQYPYLDATLRIWYVSAVPILASLFAGLTLLTPASRHLPRRRLLAAALLSLGFCFLTKVFVDSFSASIGIGNISPRPYMTRFVHVLVMEPQDNSFPSPEVMLAAALAVFIWAVIPRWGLAAVFAAASLGFARMFCGTNYLADVTVGFGMGLGWAILCLAAFRVPVSAPWAEHRWEFPLVPQAALAGVLLFGVVSGTFVYGKTQPRFDSKLTLWAAPAKAAPGDEGLSATAARAHESIQEGEGVQSDSGQGAAEALSLVKRSSLFLPDVEKYLTGVLQPKTKPFRFIEVEVAPVKAGTTQYRCAAIKIEVPPQAPNSRRWVLRVAADLIRTCFQLDSRLQNVDFTAIVKGDGKTIDGSDVVFIGNEIPVFTASIQRKNLLLPVAWQNLPAVDPGLWLRSRSRLFINDKVFPETRPVPAPAPITKPAPVTPALTPSALPAPTVVPSPTPRRVSPTAVPPAVRQPVRRPKASVPKAPARRRIQEPEPPKSSIKPRGRARHPRLQPTPSLRETAPPALSQPKPSGGAVHSPGPAMSPPAPATPPLAQPQPVTPAQEGGTP